MPTDSFISSALRFNSRFNRARLIALRINRVVEGLLIKRLWYNGLIGLETWDILGTFRGPLSSSSWCSSKVYFVE